MQKTTVRGFAPGDAKEFGPRQTQTLRTALGDVVMLLDRGYAVCRAADFVGDRYQLSSRQRTALVRAACSKAALKGRAAREINGGLEGGELIIDGFNVIITLETALSGSTVLRCMDGTLRDLCGLRGTYRLIDKTGPAVKLALSRMEVLGISSAVWVLDKPVSNSGRLAGAYPGGIAGPELLDKGRAQRTGGYARSAGQVRRHERLGHTRHAGELGKPCLACGGAHRRLCSFRPFQPVLSARKKRPYLKGF